MTGSSFHRARRYGRDRAGRLLLYAGSIVSALLTPGLVAVFGLLVHLRIGRDEPSPDLFLGLLTQPGRWPATGGEFVRLLTLIGVGLGVGLLLVVSLLIVARQVQRVALAAVAELKSAIHSQAFQLGASDLLGGRRLRPEELFTDKTEVVRRGLVAWYQAVPRAVVGIAALLLVSLAADAALTIFAVLLAISLWLLYRGLRLHSQQAAREAEEQAQSLHDTLLDDLRLSPLSAGYALDRAQNEPFEQGLHEYQRTMLRARVSLARVGPLLLLLVLLAAAMLTLVIGLSQLSFAPVMVVAAALASSAFPISRLYRLRKEMPQAEEAAGEILTYLERRASVRQQPDAQPLDSPTAKIELDRVTLADRDGRKLLDEISLAIEAGRRVGVIASDQRTPPALAGLFVRLYDPAAGRILFDGRDIRQATLDSLRSRAAMAAPSGMLFTGSVMENISCGDERFDADKVRKAAQQARALAFIERLPQGFSSVIGEHGLHLDVGQAFRIALARALVRDPSLLVIEEPDGHLDETTAADITAALHDAEVGRTVVYLPARIATLRGLDHLYLFHEGQLFAEGTHADLIRECELYRHLHYVQFNPFRNTLKS
ncbi:MAG: ABC transporter ATP-binding protein [Pirellulaceae bacterium]